MNTAEKILNWTEEGFVPDKVIRHGIRRLIQQRLNELQSKDCEAMAVSQREFIQQMRKAHIAPLPEKANEQHYEIPGEFYQRVLGRRLKYSCGYWPAKVQELDAAEEAALQETCQRARLEDGLDILELGCGWGSLTLWMAEHYPHSRITAVSNSNSQREYITLQAKRRGLKNVHVITCDMNRFLSSAAYDRIVSVEMLEHMRNYYRLFQNIHEWLNPNGLFFMHIFCHRSVPYAFMDQGPSDWMSRYFFSGGMMPSDDLPLFFQDHLKLLDRWRWDGTHYQKTANAWLANLDTRRENLLPLFERIYGSEHASQWIRRWRMFFMACAELFGFDSGQQWWVSHYLFEKRKSA